MRLRTFGLSLLALIGTFSVGSAQEATEREWEVNLTPEWHRKRMSTNFEDVKMTYRGNMWGVGLQVASVEMDNWYAAVKGSWATGKPKGKFTDGTDTYSHKSRVKEWDALLRAGYHFSMNTASVDTGITPFVGVGYQGSKFELPSGAAALFTEAPYYARRNALAQVGVLANWVCDQNWSIGLDANVATTFSAKVKDKITGVKENAKNTTQWEVEVPVGYSFRGESSMVVEGIRLVPYYHSHALGRGKGSNGFEKISNRNYGGKLEFYAFF